MIEIVLEDLKLDSLHTHTHTYIYIYSILPSAILDNTLLRVSIDDGDRVNQNCAISIHTHSLTSEERLPFFGGASWIDI